MWFNMINLKIGNIFSIVRVHCKYTLKGIVTILTVVILDFRTLNGTNLQILTPKMYDEHPRHFYMGVPPRDQNIPSFTPLRANGG